MRFYDLSRSPSGISMIEQLIATLLLMVLVLAAMKFLLLQHGSSVLQSNGVEVQQQARAAIDLMGREFTLIGTGLPNSMPRIESMEQEEISFLANLHGSLARLAGQVDVGSKKLPIDYVRNSHRFKSGRSILICGEHRCEGNRLATSGARRSLRLVESLRSTYPEGSTVGIVNKISYYTRTVDQSRRLIRKIDGGANPVADYISSFRLQYFDWAGRPVRNPVDIHRIRIELKTRIPGEHESSQTLESEIYVRNG